MKKLPEIVHMFQVTLDEKTEAEITIWKTKHGGYEITSEIYPKERR